jgi:hypothetical protein
MNKTTNVMASSLLFVATLCSAQVTSFEDSPYNFKNSPYNYENSQHNYKNSPHNYSNSSVNFNATNAVYDEKGRRTGYKTESNQGVVNYYDNSGNRRGYSKR